MNACAAFSNRTLCRRVKPIRDAAQPFAFLAITFTLRVVGDHRMAAMVTRVDSVTAFHEQPKGSIGYTIGTTKTYLLKLRHALKQNLYCYLARTPMQAPESAMAWLDDVFGRR